jgi:hypothetical protein
VRVKSHLLPLFCGECQSTGNPVSESQEFNGIERTRGTLPNYRANVSSLSNDEFVFPGEVMRDVAFDSA